MSLYMTLAACWCHGVMSHWNTKTALQLEAVEPHTIAVIALFSGGDIYRH
jgi:hypothetical protein